MTPQQLIAELEALYKKADVISDAHAYMWEDALQELDEVIASFRVQYNDWEESQPGEDDYKQHNTMNHVTQGTK